MRLRQARNSSPKAAAMKRSSRRNLAMKLAAITANPVEPTDIAVSDARTQGPEHDAGIDRVAHETVGTVLDQTMAGFDLDRAGPERAKAASCPDRDAQSQAGDREAEPEPFRFIRQDADAEHPEIADRSQHQNQAENHGEQIDGIERVFRALRRGRGAAGGAALEEHEGHPHRAKQPGAHQRRRHGR